MPSDFTNYYSSSNNVGDLSNMIEQYSKTNTPVLIIGEVGTGKDKAASLLYENGDFDNKEHKETETARNYFENSLCCLTLKLPPLRERIDDIPSITALYIHKLNISSEKQIIGLETEAMELLQSFPWPHNLDQLQHVLNELVVITNTPYITYQSVKQILKQEQTSCTFQQTSHFNFNQTLDNINYQIIVAVLKQENGNKEKTSKRLGISRSTLWRILKNHADDNDK